MNWLLDSHIHLSDPEYDSDIPYIIKCMEKMHIKACCVSEDLLSSKKTIDLSNKTDEKLEPILELINQNIGGIAGIGEIGLDSTYVSSESEFQRQEQLFRGQLAIAEKIQKPISIHSRKTLDKIYEIIP